MEASYNFLSLKLSLPEIPQKTSIHKTNGTPFGVRDLGEPMLNNKKEFKMTSVS